MAHYATIVGPLTQLLRKDAFVWNDHATQAFTTLKRALTSTPVLALPNFSKPFVMQTDNSGTGVGVVLSQKGHPHHIFQ